MHYNLKRGNDIPTPMTTSKREMLNIHVKTEERNLIDYAARICGKNRTDFTLEAARLAAEEALRIGAVYFKFVATHAEYDRTDVTTMEMR